jgi:hypothetical protein
LIYLILTLYGGICLWPTTIRANAGTFEFSAQAAFDQYIATKNLPSDPFLINRERRIFVFSSGEY